MSETKKRLIFEKAQIWFNHLKSTILLLSLATIFFLILVIVKTENQRNALFKNVCEDPLFKGHDPHCLKDIQTREHWWQHVYAAFKN